MSHETSAGGATWAGQSSGGSEQLNDLAVVSPTLAYVVGNSGGISKTVDGGATWQGQANTGQVLVRVQFLDANTGFVAGNSASFLTTTTGGATWNATTLPAACTTQNLRSMFFASASVGWVGTMDGYICKTTNGGGTWTRQYTGAGATVRALWTIDASTVYAAGDGGLIVKTVDGGATWQTLTSGTSAQLFTLSFLNPSRGYATGTGGTLLKTADGGTTWLAQSSGVTKTLRGIALLSPTRGYIVGEAGTFLAQADGAAYTYDANGNMVRRGPQKLTWDIENRPSMIVSGNVTTTFGYDAKGGRVSKSVSGGATTQYVNRYYEVNVTTGEATKYYYLGDRLIGVKKGSAAVQFVMQDHLGSTSVTADGSASSSTKYLPYGVSRSETGTLDRAQVHQPLDASTGLYWYQSRLYDPAPGRFASADPVVPKAGDPQDLNRYSYTRNNPLKYVDPTGRDEDDFYEFVGGNVSGGSEDPSQDWQGWIDELQNQFGDKVENWGAWVDSHVDFLQTASTDPSQIADRLSAVDPTRYKGIHIVGHSIGGAAAVEYLIALGRGTVPDPAVPVKSVVTLDAPLGRAYSGILGRREQDIEVAVGAERDRLSDLPGAAARTGTRALTVSNSSDWLTSHQPLEGVPYYDPNRTGGHSPWAVWAVHGVVLYQPSAGATFGWVWANGGLR